MSKALPPISDHRPASVDQNRPHNGSSSRGARHDDYQRLYSPSARARSVTADSRLSSRSVVPQLPQVEFSLGPAQERVIPPYNDLEDPHLELYWVRKEMLIQERASQRRRLHRQQEIEKQRKEEARQRFLQRRNQDLEDIASRKGEATRRREEEERQALLRSAPRKKRRPPTKPLGERQGGAAAGGRSHQHSEATNHRYAEENTGVRAEDAEGRAAGDLPNNHEYVTSSSSAATSRSASSHGNTSSSHRNNRHNVGDHTNKNRTSRPVSPEPSDNMDKTPIGNKAKDKEVAKKSPARPTSSKLTSSSANGSHSAPVYHAEEEVMVTSHETTGADVKAGSLSEDPHANKTPAHTLESSRHQQSPAASVISSKSSAAAAYLSPSKEAGGAGGNGKKEEHSFPSSTEQKTQDAYHDDDFERSSASIDSALDANGAQPAVADKVHEAHGVDGPQAAAEHAVGENYSDDDFDSDGTAQRPQTADVEKTKSEVADGAYENDSFEADYNGEEFDEDPSATKVTDAGSKLEVSKFSSSSVASSPAARTAPSPLSSSPSNAGAPPLSTSAASPAPDDEYADDFEGDV